MDATIGFVDHYRILEVDPECDERTLEAAYRHLAKLYHPDHPGTADVEKFGQVLAAYRALRSAEDRAQYDLSYAEATGYVFAPMPEAEIGLREALSDAAAHERILSLLYKRRRESPRDAGMGPYVLLQELGCGDESFDFYVWYLKQKGLIELTEQGTYAITILGVDHVISASRTTAREKLRITQGDGAAGASAA